MSDEPAPAPPRRGLLQRLTDPERPLMRILGLVGAIIAVVAFGFFLYDRFVAAPAVPAPQSSATTAPTSTALDRIAALEDGIQLSRFTDALGEPVSRDAVGPFVAAQWRLPEAEVVAYTDDLDEVVAYTVTALVPDFALAVADAPGGIRLVSSTFGDLTESPLGRAGVYPPNGQWSYEELHGGGFATDYRQVVLAASFGSTAAEEQDAGRIADLMGGCLPYSVWEGPGTCTDAELAPLSTMHITSVTVGGEEALRALSDAGAVFHPEP